MSRRSSGRSSSGGGGNRSSSGSSSVHVSGYTRSNGTHVASYTRSAPSHNSSRSSSCGVSVSGYMRSNGTQVASYTRSAPSHNSSRSSSSGVSVSGYTRSNGTQVASYTRSAPSHSGTVSNSSNVVNVSGYTRKDGTCVSPYTRSKSSASANGSSGCSNAVVGPCMTSKSTSKGASRVYADNPYNRKLGRVGEPIGSHVVSCNTKSDAVRYYSDNPVNRRLDRVGNPIPKRGNRQKEIMEICSISDLRRNLEGMEISNESRRDYEYSLDYLEQQELEERWSSDGRRLSTDVPYLESRATQNVSEFKVIPYDELKLVKEIGRGGFGVVMASLWHDNPVAFKKLHYSQMSAKQKRSFLNEITILSSLNHPHTVKLFGAVSNDEEICVGFIMEYLRRSLFRAIFRDQVHFTDEKKKEIICQITSALVYLHDDNEIAHCDIKSENILLDSNDVVKLADFGLSTVKNSTQASQSGLQVGQGTPRYSAPEVLRGDLLSKSQLFPTDIYSLAIVVFEGESVKRGIRNSGITE